MTKRTTQAYFEALSYVHQNLIPLNGSGFIIDFEAAMRSALLKLIPAANVIGCWFHFCQCLRRKMASLNKLYDAIRNDTSGAMRDMFRRYQCLALLPAEQIEPVFMKLSEDALKLSENFAEFIDYFHKEWINRVTPTHFSVYLRDTRTTSGAESFNAKVNKAFKTHGNFYHFVEKLQLEELVTIEDLQKYVNGTIARTYQKPFIKKRNKLIMKYSNLLKENAIEPYMFLKTMANIKNQVIYDDEDISLHPVEVQLSIETELVQGNDLMGRENAGTNFDDEKDSMERENAEVNFDDEFADLIYSNEHENILDVSVSQSEDETNANPQTNSTLPTQNVSYDYCEFLQLFY